MLQTALIMVVLNDLGQDVGQKHKVKTHYLLDSMENVHCD